MAELYLFIGVFLVNAPRSLVTGLVLNTSSEICTPGHFLCENTDYCVPREKNCDGNIDCPSGNDEMDCDDDEQDLIWDSMFKKRPSAVNDDVGNGCNLSYNGSCVCRDRDLLCGHKKLERIPEDLPRESIMLLDFEVNTFRVLSKEFLEPIPKYVEKIPCNDSSF